MESKNVSRRHRHVDEPIAVIGAAVVDPDNDRPVVGEVGDKGVTGNRQGRMRGREALHVEHFAIGGTPAVEVLPVKGRQTLGPIVRILIGYVRYSGNHIRFADSIGPAALGDWLTKFDYARAGGDPVFRVDSAGGLALRAAMGERKAAEGKRPAPRRSLKTAPNAWIRHWTPPCPSTASARRP